MREEFKILKNDRLSFWAVAFSLIFLIFNFSLLIFNFPKLPPQVPLFFSRPWGEAQLARKEELFLLPGLASLVLLLNVFLAQKFYPKETAFFRILTWLAAIFTLLTAWISYQIVRLVI